MKNLWTIFALASSLYAAPVDDFGTLKVVGNAVTSSKTGLPAALRGMSFYHGQNKGGRDWVNRGVISWIASDWHANVIRIPMMINDEGGTSGGVGYISDPTGSMKMVDSVVQAAIDLGIYVVIDWHEEQAPTHQSQAVTFFSTEAAKWGSHPNVIYEIYNEPNGPTWPTIKTYATAVIAAIRAKDANNLIVVGTPSWDQDLMSAANAPLTGVTNVAYSFHYYASDQNHQAFRVRADSAMTKGIALFVTEWGNSDASGGGTLNTGYMDAYMNWITSAKISWCNWSLSDVPETSAALENGTWNAQGLINHVISTTGGWTNPATQLSQSGNYVRSKMISLNAAYTPPGSGTSTTSSSSKATSSASNVLTVPELNSIHYEIVNSGVEINLGDSRNWVSAQMMNIMGHELARTEVEQGQATIRLISSKSFAGPAIIKLTSNDGSSYNFRVTLTK